MKHLLSRRDFIARFLSSISLLTLAGAVTGCDGEKYPDGEDGEESSETTTTNEEPAASTPQSDSQRDEPRVFTDEVKGPTMRNGIVMKCPAGSASQVPDNSHIHRCEVSSRGHIVLVEQNGHAHAVRLDDEDTDELCRTGEIRRRSSSANGHDHLVIIRV